MSKRRVVVTGLGALTPIGNNIREYWEGLIEGRNGIEMITSFDTSKHSTKFAGEIKNFNTADHVDRKSLRRMDNFTIYSLVTADEAIKNSGINLEEIDTERFGVIYGSGIGGISTYEEISQLYYFNDNTPQKIMPYFVTKMISDIAAGQISIKYGLRGPNYSTTSACATSAHSITDGFMQVERGNADIMLVGGAEASITELSVGGFNAMRALSTWNDRFKEASRPFDKDRTGFVMGEGSGTLILEELEHAKKRGANIYAEICGIGLTADAYHITAPDPEGDGARRSMLIALQDAGLKPEDIDYINAHGTSTVYNDATETKAIKKAFGEHAYNLIISSVKSMTGHLLGAAGAVEAIATCLTIKNDVIPPTINLDEADPECDLNYSPNKKTETKVNAAISNAFGFGGHNASILFKKFEE